MGSQKFILPLDWGGGGVTFSGIFNVHGVTHSLMGLHIFNVLWGREFWLVEIYKQEDLWSLVTLLPY